MLKIFANELLCDLNDGTVFDRASNIVGKGKKMLLTAFFSNFHYVFESLMVIKKFTIVC